MKKRFSSIERVWLGDAEVLVAHEWGRPYEGIALIGGELVKLVSRGFNRDTQRYHSWEAAGAVADAQLLSFLLTADEFVS